jgi:shikimate kinase
MERCWILIGMMGAGKSTVGRGLASLVNREFIDSDALIEKRVGRSVGDIFRVYSEDAFRDHENSILKGLEASPVVIATGGGIVLREDNWNELRRLGTTVYLKVESDVLIKRLESSHKKRPLLDSEDWQDQLKAILKSREAFYNKADITIDVSRLNAEAAIEATCQALQAYERSASNERS